MVGHQQVEQTALFYEFSLETHVPRGGRPSRIYFFGSAKISPG